MEIIIILIILIIKSAIKGLLAINEYVIWLFSLLMVKKHIGATGALKINFIKSEIALAEGQYRHENSTFIFEEKSNKREN